MLLGFALSNHAPVLLIAHPHPIQVRETQNRMNTKDILDPCLQEQIEEMWREEIKSTKWAEELDTLLHWCLFKAKNITRS